MFVQVALPIPKHSLLTYRLSDDATVEPGTLVLVPLAKSYRVGVVWQVTDKPLWQGGEIRFVTEILEEKPLLDANLLHLLSWVASYYLSPIGSVVAAAVPGHLRFQQKRKVLWSNNPIPSNLSPSLKPLAEKLQKSGKLQEKTLATNFGRSGLKNRLKALLKLDLITIDVSWHSSHPDPSESILSPPENLPLISAPKLNLEQNQHVEILTKILHQKIFAPFLLQGVTGSGKTEVYFHAVQVCLDLGRQALLLVPEISLTPQLIQRYQARFQEGLAIFHSQQSSRQRFHYWHDIRDGKARVVIGARSAIFAPFSDLGLIVVDEEHEGSYKQESPVPYQARDMAVVRARQAKALLILGSATPSLETLSNVDQGRYQALYLTKRATGTSLPKVEMIDLSNSDLREKMRFDQLLSPPLMEAMVQTLASKRQILLFLNRRGFAPSLLCRRCGAAVTCPNCSVTLTLHKSKSQLVCHYCDHHQVVIDVCTSCGQLSLFDFGPGTERLEQEVRTSFPEARIARLDRDTVTSGGTDLTLTLKQFYEQKLDILLGTQMIAKGHHFPGLALVGVVQAETTLCQPDFRAAERTFQLVTQVAGRAGREEEVGKVMVQSFDPKHYALQAVVNHDVHHFSQMENRFRKEAGYPPFHRLALLRFSSSKQKEGEQFDLALRAQLVPNKDVVYLGPAPSPIFKLRNRFRWQMLIKETTPNRLHQTLKPLLLIAQQLAGNRIRVVMDVDPNNFL